MTPCPSPRPSPRKRGEGAGDPPAPLAAGLSGEKSGGDQGKEFACQFRLGRGPTRPSTVDAVKPKSRGWPIGQAASIGIGGHLAMPPLPHHRAYGSVPRRFGGLSARQLFHGDQAETTEARF